MKEWIKSSLWEIKRSGSLQILGAIFAFLHLMSYFIWRKSASIFLTGTPDLCWPMFPNCAGGGSYNSEQIQFLVVSYTVMASLALICFIARRLTGFAWFLLLSAFCIKMFFYLSDASLAANPHILHFAVEFCFLFIPNKGPIIRAIVLSYYLVLGGLKLNSTWLSGMWLADQLPFPAKVLEWIAAFSALIELIIPFGLFMRSGEKLAIAFITLFLYHGFYWFVGGPFEPITMMALLVFFLAAHIEQHRNEREYMYQSFSRPEPTKMWWPIIFLSFWFLQLGSLIFPKNMTNHFMQLQAHAAPKECYQRNFIIYENGLKEYADDFVSISNEELKCNSFVHFKAARNLCHKYKAEPQFLNVASYFYVRNFAKADFKRIFEFANICDPDVKYRDTKGGPQ